MVIGRMIKWHQKDRKIFVAATSHRYVLNRPIDDETTTMTVTNVTQSHVAVAVAKFCPFYQFVII